MRAGDIILLLTLNNLVNKVTSNSQEENNGILSKPSNSLKERSDHLSKTPILSLIDKKIEAYEALQEPYESVHHNEEVHSALAANEGASKSDSNSQQGQRSNSSISWMQNPGVLAGIICTCLVVGLIFLLLVVFCIYRLRKRDEGSYALDEPKKMLPPSSEYSKAPTREFYA